MLGFLKRWLGRAESVPAMEKAARGSPASGESALASNNFGNAGLTPRELARYNRGWVYAAIRPIAQRIAGQPIKVGNKVKRRKPAGTKATMPSGGPPWMSSSDVEEDPNHPLLDALNNPNDLLVAYSLLQLTVFSLQITGVCYWWIDDSDGVTKIWYLAPHWVRPEGEEGQPFAKYMVRPTNGMEEIELSADKVIRFHLPDPFDPIYGSVSPLHAASKAVDADESLQESQRRAFRQGINPGMALVVGRMPGTGNGIQGQRPELTKDQRTTLINAVKAQYAGAVNSNEPLILDAIIEDVKKISNTPAEMDYLQSGEATKDRIFQVFGTNPIVAGQVEGANRASSTIAGEHFNDYTVNPLAALISQTMTGWFAAHYDDPTLVVWIEPARVRDPDARRADLDQLGRFGAVTKNELRAEHGMGPLAEGGDELVQVSSQQPTPGTTQAPKPDDPAAKSPKDFWWKYLTPAEQIQVYKRAKAQQRGA